jgi:hypothetical protein
MSRTDVERTKMDLQIGEERTHCAAQPAGPIVGRRQVPEEKAMYVFIIALLMFFVPLPASAQVQVNLGINFSAPPPLVAVPEVQAVQYVPTASANLFFYGGQYWAYANGTWYYSSGYNGPWVLAAPAYVPQPLLIVPVTYYRRPPPEWRGYHPGVPPRWDSNYGRSWSGKREAFVEPHGQPAHNQPVHDTAHAQPVHEAPPPHAVHEERPPERAPVKEEHPPEHGGEEGHH